MNIQAVVFDWAGTTVDYGCFAPLAAFVEIFTQRGIEVTAQQAREPMGLLKYDHIKAMCNMGEIARQWQSLYGRTPDEEDAKLLYSDFEPKLFEILAEYAEPVPGVIELIKMLKRTGIKVGSTTGYTRCMVDIVAKAAEAKGYKPDCIVAATDVPGGRPHPYMCYQNAINLGVYPLYSMIKVGDTIADIKEGLNAGMWSVGIIKGSSELGLTEHEVNSMEPALLAEKMAEVRQRYLACGAHFTITEIGEVATLLDEINDRLKAGERPYDPR